MTLLVWDQEVRGGQNAAMTQLNKNFQKQYPNIKINRVAKSFTDLQATLKLAASGPNPPDVIEVNNGYSAMGPLVKAKLLLNLNKYAGKYGWNTRYSTGLLKMNKFTSDGNSFGIGNLYGLPMTGEVVGVYYNKATLKKLGLKMPTTFQQFKAAVSKAQARGPDADPVRQPRQVARASTSSRSSCSSTSRARGPATGSSAARGAEDQLHLAGHAQRRRDAPELGQVGQLHQAATRVSATTRRGPTSARARASS